LPGLIDSHTHLLLDVVVPPQSEINRRSNGMFLPGPLLAKQGLPNLHGQRPREVTLWVRDLRTL